ncbi:hypothetical protein AMR72_08695 [Flavobacterium psychrophilum]|nr:hypothetical protein AMR72_08695 [Flavobacterium psychrophilum]AOE54362.1 hypothetical protein ALW18_08685 [Flavobacterium psychrophilum]
MFIFLTKRSLLVCLLLFSVISNAQDSDFWDRVRFGGGLGLGFGSGYTDVTIAPGAIYQFNEYVALGAGLQFSYVDQKNFYSAKMYGANGIVLFNPIPEVQLSAEVEQLRVNLDVDTDRFGQYEGYSRDFWNTGLFLGAGYNVVDNVTIGIRYNVLYNDNDFVYSQAWMPFVRVYF